MEERREQTRMYERRERAEMGEKREKEQNDRKTGTQATKAVGAQRSWSDNLPYKLSTGALI